MFESPDRNFAKRFAMFVDSQPKHKTTHLKKKRQDYDMIGGHAQYGFISPKKKILVQLHKVTDKNKPVFSNAQKLGVKRPRRGAFLFVLELLLITCAVNDNPSAVRLCNTWAGALTNLRAVHDRFVLR